ncbi:39S ribosomal protein L2, mitochondrial [Schistocerca nitens]|uniref:39S ribosomal protein L2, mitochondrial n=1 Tax=Schistocerca nitens TaxID=7011 RepID=UPI002117BC85|nr:39S ribosomal protein L2, mitochondrial [Schistocerca nitens]
MSWFQKLSLRSLQNVVCGLNQFLKPLENVPVRWKSKVSHLEVPKPGVKGKSYRRIVHYEEKYTVKPLRVTNLGGRDPVTGRLVAKGIGGGIKHKYHWIDWKRIGPSSGPPLVERVLQILVDGCRTAHIALVGSGDNLRYILATENMKEGDLIKTSSEIPRIAVRANEGDAYPLGALQVGTQVHCVEKYPGLGGFFVHAAGTYATVLRKTGDRVIIQLPSKREVSLAQECMATVGRLSNIMHGKTPIGSATRNRELGNRPRSGLWQRKDGRHGRKIRRLPPVRVIGEAAPKPPTPIRLTLNIA